ncbi:Veg family protein [Clostridium sp. Marseille-P299]|uniref:Veg family protein n=1 Tax=Clostridium sp. Marseille-P299 TaxID=1805477 RepID=UPI0008348EA4|nr:Veg family protein [Clostridium sp. Marseille-P299]
MRQPENMCYVRNSVVKNIGKKVKVRSYRGRNKVDVAEGIISATYPCVFLIELDGNSPDSLKTMSFSYTDVLTKEVELVLC